MSKSTSEAREETKCASSASETEDLDDRRSQKLRSARRTHRASRKRTAPGLTASAWRSNASLLIDSSGSESESGTEAEAEVDVKAKLEGPHQESRTASSEENSLRATNSPRTLRGRLFKAQTELSRGRQEFRGQQSLLHQGERELASRSTHRLRRENQELAHAVEAQRAARERAIAEAKALKQSLKNEWKEKTALMATYRADIKALECKLQKAREQAARADLARDAQIHAETERDRALQELGRRSCILEAAQDTIASQTAEIQEARARANAAKEKARQHALSVASLEQANDQLSEKLDALRSESQTLHVQLHEQSSEAEQAQSEIASLREEVAGLRNTMAQLRVATSPPSNVSGEANIAGTLQAAQARAEATEQALADLRTELRQRNDQTLQVRQPPGASGVANLADIKVAQNRVEAAEQSMLDARKELQQRNDQALEVEQTLRNQLAVLAEDLQTAQARADAGDQALANLRAEFQHQIDHASQAQQASESKHANLLHDLQAAQKRAAASEQALKSIEVCKGCETKSEMLEKLRLDHEKTMVELCTAREQEGSNMREKLKALENQYWRARHDHIVARLSRAMPIKRAENLCNRATSTADIPGNLERECAALQAQLDESAKVIAERDVQLEQFAKTASCAQKLRCEKEALQQKLDNLSSTLTAVQSREDAQRTKLASLEANVKALQSSLSSSEAKAQDATRSLEGNLERTKNNLDASQRALRELKADYETACSRIVALQGDQDKLLRTVAEAKLGLDEHIMQHGRACAREAAHAALSRRRRSDLVAALRGWHDQHLAIISREQRLGRALLAGLCSLQWARKAYACLLQTRAERDAIGAELRRERVRSVFALSAGLAAFRSMGALRHELDQLEETRSFRSAEGCASPCGECAATHAMLVETLREKKRIAASLAETDRENEALAQRLKQQTRRRQALVGDLEAAVADRDRARERLERAHEHQDELKGAVGRLAARARELEGELASGREASSRLARENEERAGVIQVLRDEMQSLTDALEETKSEVAAVVCAVQEAQRLARSRLRALQEQGGELEDVKQDLAQHREQLRHAKNAQAQANAEASALKTQFANREADLLDQISTAHARLAETAEELHARQLTLEKANADCGRLELQLACMQTTSVENEDAKRQLRSLEDRLHAAKLATEGLEVRLSQKERETARHEEVATARLGRLETLQRDLDAASHARARADDELEATREDLESLKSRVAQLEDALRASRDASTRIEDALGVARQEKATLETELLALRAENDKVRECLRDAREEVRDLLPSKKALAAREESLEQVEAANARLQQRVDDLEASKYGLMASQARAEQEAERARSDTQLVTLRDLEARAELAALQKAHAAAQQRLADLEDLGPAHEHLQGSARAMADALVVMTNKYHTAEAARRQAQGACRTLLMQCLKLRVAGRRLESLSKAHASLETRAKSLEVQVNSLAPVPAVLAQVRRELDDARSEASAERTSHARSRAGLASALWAAQRGRTRLEAERAGWMLTLRDLEHSADQLAAAREEIRRQTSAMDAQAADLDAARTELAERMRELRRGEGALRKRSTLLQLQEAKVEDALAASSQVQALNAQLRVQERASEVLRERLNSVKPASPVPKARVTVRETATSPVPGVDAPHDALWSPDAQRADTLEAALSPVPGPETRNARSQVDPVSMATAGTQTATPADVSDDQADDGSTEAEMCSLKEALAATRAEKSALVGILMRAHAELLEG